MHRAILNLTDGILIKIIPERSIHFLGVFIDLSKVLHTVNHSILLQK